MPDVLDDPVEFARQVLGIEIFPYQQEALRTKKRVTGGVGGRRTGKTLIGQVKATKTCMQTRNAEVIITSANESSMKRWVSEAADLINASSRSRDATIDIEQSKITFRNGAALVGLPPTSSALRGRGRKVHGIVIDEPSLCAPTLWSDLRFVLLDNIGIGAWAYMAGPPVCGPEHFARQVWNQGQQGDPDTFSFSWSTLDNPLNDRDWLEREIGRLNSIEAEPEIFGRWLTDGLQFFSHRLLETVTADLELPELRELLGPARPIIAADFGVSYDSSAVAAIYRLPVRALNPEWDPAKPVFAVVPHVWPAGELLNTVVDQIVEIPVEANFYGLEENGCSAMPSQEVERRVKKRPVRHGDKRLWYSAPTSNARKIAGYSLWRWLMERGQCVLPRHPTLLRQLAGLRLDTQGRLPRIEAEDPAVHDDASDCLMLGALTYVDGNSVRCRLADLASAGAPRDTSHPDLDLPIVETGGGLRTYQRPVFQSVADQRITLPSGAGPAVHRNMRDDSVREQVRQVLHPSEKERTPHE